MQEATQAAASAGLATGRTHRGRLDLAQRQLSGASCLYPGPPGAGTMDRKLMPRAGPLPLTLLEVFGGSCLQVSR